MAETTTARAIIELKTAAEWNRDPRNKIRVLSWSDFGYDAEKDGVTRDTLITWDDFRKYRSYASVQLLVPFDQLGPED